VIVAAAGNDQALPLPDIPIGFLLELGQISVITLDAF
jgi:hypothetical protein